MPRLQSSYGHGRLGLCVLDHVTLVQHEIFKRNAAEHVDIVAHNVVGADDEVVSGQLWSQSGPEIRMKINNYAN